MKARAALATLAGVAGALLVGACSRPVPGAVDVVQLSGRITAEARYVTLAAQLVARGTGVWVESDFVKASQAGPARYRQVLSIALDLARRPGVSGIKIADELGYHDGTDPAHARALLRQATQDIHSALPTSKVLIDMVVPELGCLSWTREATADMRLCGASTRVQDPGATIAAVDDYIASSGLDVLDLSPGLRDDSWYAAQGSSRDAAMRIAWREAARRWGGRVTLQARKALAHPGRYPYTAARAEADVHTFVDIPLSEGAKAVDIWTWAQLYQGQFVTLTDPGAKPNALTRALQERRKKGAAVWTHMTPSALQVDLGYDVVAASREFDAIFVAAGTG